jgi:hypothetical protein
MRGDDMTDKNLVRVYIRVSKKTHDEMMTLIPWGLRRNVHETVLQLVLDAIRSDGMVVAGAILDGHFKLVRVDKEAAQNWGGVS